MKIRIAATIFTAVFLIQGTLLNAFEVYSTTPNLILCLMIALTFFYENEDAIYFAIVFGFVSDICYSNIVGISSLGYLTVGFLIVNFRSVLNKENILSHLILGALGTFTFNIICWAGVNVAINQSNFIYVLLFQPFYIIYNLIIIVIIYYILINKVIKYRSDRYYR
jgi:rod shape-determining protein MreD